MKNQPNVTLPLRKKILFTCTILVVFWALLDVVGYFALQRMGGAHHLFYDPPVPSDRDLEAFYREIFHPRWGWDIASKYRGPLGNRKSHDHGADESFKIKFFGDSFTFGGVHADDTISYYFEERTGWTCLNFGVRGYGTDQALLKYQDNRVRSEYVFLGILDENIGRCMTNWWGFYHGGSRLGTKPRFQSRNGIVALVENPITNLGESKRLQNAEFVETLKEHDYWTGYFQDIDAPPRLAWPASRVVLSHAGFFVRNAARLLQSRISPTYETEIGLSNYYHLYERDSEGLAVMRHIVNEFIEIATRRQEIPIIAVFPTPRSLDIFRRFRKKPYQNLLDHLEDIRCHYVDFSDILVTEDNEAWYLPKDSHLRPEGYRKIAEHLATMVRQIDANRAGSQ